MIHISNVEFYYKKGRGIFNNIDLKLQKGRIYGLLGRNGIGKSTLLNLISGIVFPKSGEIEVLGEKPQKRLPSLMTRLYYLPEEVTTPVVSMKQYAKYTSPFYINFSYDDLKSYLEEFEVSDDQKISTMSLGQRKKAMIAFAIACNTPLLLMDEPTNGLDIPSKSQFRKIIARVATEERCVVISTHQVRDLDKLIDSLVILDGQGVVVNASTEHISQNITFKTLEVGEVSIYEENGFKGRWGVVENKTKRESSVDIELFFNAAIAKPEIIKSLLTR